MTVLNTQGSIVGPLPPPELRALVSCTDAEREYIEIGIRTASTIHNVLARHGHKLADFPRVLDFACGCGRTIHSLQGNVPETEICGCDYDARLIEWCAANLPGEYRVNHSDPPTTWLDGSFDLIYAISFFTHIPGDRQLAWLREWKRLLRPHGLILLTALGPEFASREQTVIPAEGIVHVSRGEAFNAQLTYQTPEYCTEAWTPILPIQAHEALALNNAHDIVILGHRPSLRPLPPKPLPDALKEVYARRVDLHAHFVSDGQARQDSTWRNLTLEDWAMLNGWMEEPSLFVYRPASATW